MAYRFDLGRFIMLLASLIIVIIFFSVGGAFGYGFGGYNLSGNTLVFLVGLVVALAVVGSLVRVVPSKDNQEITTETRCPVCGFLYQRSFVNGDFISKQDKACPKDGTPTLVNKIYVVDNPPGGQA
jgi:hypothetical protein